MHYEMVTKKTRRGVADAVRKAFEQSGWSMLRWSKESSVPYASVREFARMNRDPRTTTLEKLTRALGLRLVVEERQAKKRKVKRAT